VAAALIGVLVGWRAWDPVCNGSRPASRCTRVRTRTASAPSPIAIEADLAPMWDALRMAEAVSLPLVALTAWLALVGEGAPVTVQEPRVLLQAVVERAKQVPVQ
jgi:NADPH:quinone reductase-like Zn-dependent oxidoreductase